jgi:4-amino-4-deoxy-L-arabinose transferase-like glycosyltransferase
MSVLQEPAQETILSNQPRRLPRRLAFTWHQIGLGAILLLSACLNLIRLDQQGYTNEFYAAAVRSMLVNWHNFFFNSFDPGGFITIDKPPVAFWLQALSAGIFGFSGVTILLPSALAGVASVGLLYLTVKRVFGPTAGLIAALALAVNPIFVVMSRHNNPEAILVLSLVVAAWALTHAAEKGKVAWLCLAVGMVGVGFNVKMLEAFIVLPAFYLVYFLLAPVKWWVRILQLALATVVLVVVSLSWATIVDLTPANQRPYIGGSTDNTVLNLAFNYNGLDRIEGNGFGGGGGGRGFGGQNQQSGGITGFLGHLFNGVQIPFFSNSTPTTGRGGFGGGGGVIAGQAGLFRMFERDLAGEAGWLLPMALLAIGIIALQSRKRFPKGLERRKRYQGVVLWGGWLLTFMVVFSGAEGIFHSYYLVMLSPAISALFGAGAEALWHDYKAGGWRRWLLPVVLLLTALFEFNILSVYSDWNRTIALVMIALELAVGCILLAVPRLVHPEGFRWAAWVMGVGLVGLLIAPFSWALNALFSRTFSNATLPTAVPVGGTETNFFGFGNRAAQGFIQVLQANWNGWLSTLVIGLLILAALTIALRFLLNRLKGLKPLEKISTLGTVTIVIVLGISMAETALPPTAAASSGRGQNNPPSTGVIGNPDMTINNNEKLITYLNANRDGAQFILATTSSQNASPIIIKTGEPVMALGGFMGSDKVLTLPQLQQDVRFNTVRFFLLDGSAGFGGGRGGFGGGNNQLTNWVGSSCKVVDPSLWSASAGAATNRNTQTGNANGAVGNANGQGALPGSTGRNNQGNQNQTGQPGGNTRGGFGNTGGFPAFGGNGGTTGNNNNRGIPQPAFGGGFGGGRGGASGTLYDCQGAN